MTSRAASGSLRVDNGAAERLILAGEPRLSIPVLNLALDRVASGPKRAMSGDCYTSGRRNPALANGIRAS
jgi:hypothetical protein